MVNYMLPNTLRPDHYDILLKPNLVTGNFSGRINIKFNVIHSTNEIVLHSKGLNIHRNSIRINVLNKGGVLSTVSSLHQNETTDKKDSIKIMNIIETLDDREFLNIELNQEMLEGEQYEVIMDYDGIMKNKINGFYWSEYVSEKGEKRSIATSKFEPTYARQAFPCFDEPNMKAKYSVKLVRPTYDNYIALSNMDQINEEQYNENETLVTFKESVPMSTYLTCFIVCDFAYTERIIQPPKNLGEPFPFRVYATPAQRNKTELALEVGAKIIQFYIDYFQISYPLPKLDMVAIPDFPSGAMETWGLVTFRETAVLYSPNTSSVLNKERVATVVGHELAHMWFGNLVTMKWWNELWLNEGFATYIEYLGVDQVFKDWEMENQFIIAELHRAFETDAKLSSHPIVVNVTNPDEITAVFDAISYSKGASLLRMLRNFVGNEVFRQGVTKYLNKNLYGSAKSEDLYEAIQELVGDQMNVKDIMYTWTKQMGYPEIIVEVAENSTDVLKITQKRFLLNADDVSDKEDSVYGYRWTIPITYITNLDPEPKLKFFPYNNDTLKIQLDPNTKWIKFNVNQNGYYRVNYNKELWSNLIDNYQNFSIADRTSLINDAFNLAYAKRLDYGVPLTLSQKLINESDVVPWRTASSALYRLKELLHDSEVYPKYQQFVLQLLQPSLQKINWEPEENEPHLHRHLRISILKLACEFEDPRCLEEAGQRLKSFVEDKQNVPHQDIRSVVFNYGMWSVGTQKEWDILWERYLLEDDAQVKATYRNGLAHARSTSLLSRYLTLAWNPQYVRRQDYVTTLTSISGNPIGTQLVWDYVRDNWDAIVKEFGLNDRYLGRMIPDITESFTNERKLNEMKDFFAKYPNAGAGASARKQAIENVKTNIKWLERNLLDIKNWLDKNVKV
ncbi:glutamyl aminopeptidase-like [Chrysoperla carnea]|uniref:glutamyl aminopeptidase-like n=1 Tax=Chrysoperla carnea TaxID=189513 RepID=UPI001D08065A|nr:glutamyl aminopeptidase-like [Chrysoperla carnea]